MSHDESGEVDRHCEKEGDREDREAKRERERERQREREDLESVRNKET